LFIGTWFNRAVTLDPDFGDAWAHFYKFEQINGSKDNTDAIVQRVKKAQPRHGGLLQDFKIFELFLYILISCRPTLAVCLQADYQLEFRGEFVTEHQLRIFSHFLQPHEILLKVAAQIK
jgi:hypothetical protein